MSDVFLPLIGQYDNIGDIVLRRELLRWVSGDGVVVHTYLGKAPAGYVDGLALPPDTVTYTSVGPWIRAALSSARKGSASGYFYKPGEIQLTLPGMKEHLGLLPAVRMLSQQGLPVMRVGAGAHKAAGKVATAAMRLSIADSHHCHWRDPWTQGLLGGHVMPDLGFGQHLSGLDEGEHGSGPRESLVISLRGDRPMPDQDWRLAVRRAAKELGLTIRIVTQVYRDNARGAELAAALDASFEPWNGTAHLDHERRLRQVYRGAMVTLSDRLHVLIVALTEGSVPCFAFPWPAEKVERHFRTVDSAAHEIFDTSACHPESVRDVLMAAAAKTGNVAGALAGVRSDLAQTRSHVLAAIGR